MSESEKIVSGYEQKLREYERQFKEMETACLMLKRDADEASDRASRLETENHLLTAQLLTAETELVKRGVDPQALPVKVAVDMEARRKSIMEKEYGAPSHGKLK